MCDSESAMSHVQPIYTFVNKCIFVNNSQIPSYTYLANRAQTDSYMHHLEAASISSACISSQNINSTYKRLIICTQHPVTVILPVVLLHCMLVSA